MCVGIFVVSAIFKHHCCPLLLLKIDLGEGCLFEHSLRVAISLYWIHKGCFVMFVCKLEVSLCGIALVAVEHLCDELYENTKSILLSPLLYRHI